ncbi:hypothetical protein AQUCO_00201151v1 [Aquilegia coerulea]|uniref:CRM domain-containing protein n=1 Tax=Aquilegia coerulea TaxID=218851 RepID=A0A2G5F6I7_AQUCA|nr:hypothetical protein AQUCO_00201151v1 [Aquilegia coerulea]
MALAFATAKLTEYPLHHNSISLNLFFSTSKPTFLSLKPFSSSSTTTSYISSSIRTTEHSNNSRVRRKPYNSSKTSGSSAPWIKKWTPIKDKGDTEKKNLNLEKKRTEEEDQVQHKYFGGDKGRNSIERIVTRLRNLGLGSDDEEEEEEVELDEENGNVGYTGEEKLGDLLQRNWGRPDTIIDDEEDEQMLLPWERPESEFKSSREVEGKKLNDRRVKAPTLAELTIEDVELRRLRTQGMTLRERINIAKAGVTTVIVEKIHEKWRKSELVRLKFHETLANDMRTAHEIVERRTGGLVIWRSGSVMVVFRGINYEKPSSRPQSVDDDKKDTLFVPEISSADNLTMINGTDTISTSDKIEPVTIRNPVPTESLTEDEVEYNNLLDGLGPRFVDWWGTGWLPIDADLLPPTIPGYKTPFRSLPTGMRSRLTNAEMTNLRKVAKTLPSHFALGRNRNHQGLACSIVKLWEKSLVAKIAVKRGIQNTNNKIMADEIKMLTGGTLLLRNKYYIVIYRGKDFLPTSVAAALTEREELTKEIQDVEEKVRGGASIIASMEQTEGKPLAGTLAEFYEAQARWGKELSAEDLDKMKEEAAREKHARVVKRIEHKLAVAEAKQTRAERLLSKIEASMVPVGPCDDQETITDEERFMFRRVGLKMKAYLPIGIRGVFAGVIENMHLHWKHRELVKLISKQKTLSFVEETARLLEYESGGILVAIERVPKGFALIYYRGKNYQRPISLRPRNLLTKAKALKRSVAMQRHEVLSYINLNLFSATLECSGTA